MAKVATCVGIRLELGEAEGNFWLGRLNTVTVITYYDSLKTGEVYACVCTAVLEIDFTRCNRLIEALEIQREVVGY
ncbi:predicted protein [Histoplasma capsulatum G186AR]|uniref:Uncharacterized protein n=1 Tax=Ajellomyces capsulatus (strain G186AR / H82 / ATCC MYA-2454 / RMSCC 2432) TaxID=447093 RepID=C0NPA6_AJECG|nr:uncharacterized protein HCBG_04986 [Histoplasma capsulatum G186AR]EEH06766.1 predicted protein [Histoplasma capsulatum G186AR]